jgi:hypothetical protein
MYHPRSFFQWNFIIMDITSVNGKRTLSVSPQTRDRVIDYIAAHPYKTVTEYANAVYVAETTINLIIERYLPHMVSAGRIAVSSCGRKPDWYYHVRDVSIIPVRKPVKRFAKLSIPDIDPQLRRDYAGLATLYNIATIRTLSPARRRLAQQEFAERIVHISGAHQDAIDTGASEVARLTHETTELRETMQMLATVVTNATVKTAVVKV